MAPITTLSIRKFIHDGFLKDKEDILWRADSFDDLHDYFKLYHAVTFSRLKRYIEVDPRLLEYFVCKPSENTLHDHRNGECFARTNHEWFVDRLNRARQRMRAKGCSKDPLHKLSRIDQEIADLQERRLRIIEEIEEMGKK